MNQRRGSISRKKWNLGSTNFLAVMLIVLIVLGYFSMTKEEQRQNVHLILMDSSKPKKDPSCVITINDDTLIQVDQISDYTNQLRIWLSPGTHVVKAFDTSGFQWAEDTILIEPIEYDQRLWVVYESIPSIKAYKDDLFQSVLSGELRRKSYSRPDSFKLVKKLRQEIYKPGSSDLLIKTIPDDFRIWVERDLLE